MSDAEYEFLRSVRDADGLTYVDSVPDDQREIAKVAIVHEYLSVINDLRSRNVMQWRKVYDLTDAGRAALLDFEQERQRRADEKAEAEAKQAAKDAKAILDKKQADRHDFKVAAFTVVLTLALEHCRDIVNLVKHALKALGLL